MSATCEFKFVPRTLLYHKLPDVACVTFIMRDAKIYFKRTNFNWVARNPFGDSHPSQPPPTSVSIKRHPFRPLILSIQSKVSDQLTRSESKSRGRDLPFKTS